MILTEQKWVDWTVDPISKELCLPNLQQRMKEIRRDKKQNETEDRDL